MLHSIPPIKNRIIRIAIVGCGRISENHIKAIALYSDRAKIVAFCDTIPQKIESAKKFLTQSLPNNVTQDITPKSFFNYNELIKASNETDLNIDLLILATPSGLHASQVILAAQAGIHVCTEKPMATRWSDGLKMVKACDEAQTHLFVVKQNRFNSTLQLVKKQLEINRFGNLAMVTINVFWHRPQDYYDQAKWRGTWELDGGALMNQASHYVDLLTWLIGPLESLSASVATISRNIESEDTAALQLKWRNGALGTMAVTMLTYPKNLEGSITILGDKGTVRIGGKAVNKIEHWDFMDKNPDDLLVEDASYETSSIYGFGHPLYYSNLIDVLNGKAEAMCNGREGLHSLETIIGAYRSARDKKTIGFPLEY